MSQKVEWKVIFHGQVQGVGFRATVYHLAIRIGVTGYVRNCPDGTVEMVGQAPEYLLQQLLEEIREQFGSGYITLEEQKILPFQQEYPSFQIVR